MNGESETVFIGDDTPPGDRATIFCAWLCDLIRSGDLTPQQVGATVTALRAALEDNNTVVRYAARLLNPEGDQ